MTMAHSLSGAVRSTSRVPERFSSLTSRIVNTGTIVEHDCRIGRHCHLAPGCALSGGVTVGDEVHLGTGTVCIQGVRVGAGSIAAAGSVVVGDIRPGQKIFGIPAKEKEG